MKTATKCFLIFFIFLFTAVSAYAAVFQGYSEPQGTSITGDYQYALFGSYPTEEDGEEKPVLWRILGPGTPEKEDVICYSNYPPRKWVKQANGDSFTEENEDAFCFMTEYILDMVLYHTSRDNEEAPLDYENSAMYETLNGPFLTRLFSPSEQSVLIEMPRRGKLSLASRKGELFRTDYGFPAEDFVPSRTRRAKGTPYAYKQGLKRIAGFSWYFTTDWRRFGARWIVGDNGHISVSGVDRKGGVRLICYMHADRLEIDSGRGTMEDPFVLTPKEHEE